MTAIILSIVSLIVSPALAYNPPPSTTLIAFLFRPQIIIQLPPRLIMTPATLAFPNKDEVYNFSASTGKFIPEQGRGTYQSYKVTTSLNGTGDGAYYTITIKGFKINEKPDIKDFRLTFKEPVSKASIDKVENYLNPKLNNPATTARLSAPDCTIGSNKNSHICLETITKVKGGKKPIRDAYLHQTIPLHGIFVPGNVAAGGRIEGFSLDANSLAVGGEIKVDGGTQLKNYLNGQSTSISWGEVEGQVKDMFNKGLAIGSPINSAKINFDKNHYKASSWNLNAPAQDPVVNSSTSFSTPPEGKVWKHTNPLFIDAVNTNFSGSGTIVVKGDLVINGKISCQGDNTRLAFLVNGNITINTNEIGCGAYIAMGGSITLKNSTSGNLKGIFIARDSVILPNPAFITGTYLINYDSYLASHPTALIGELLKLVIPPS